MDQKEDGSITVFLSIIFLLFFAMFGVTFENVRSLISAGHVRTSAYSAAVTKSCIGSMVYLGMAAQKERMFLIWSLRIRGFCLKILVQCRLRRTSNMWIFLAIGISMLL